MPWPKGKSRKNVGVVSGKTPRLESNVRQEDISTESCPSPSTIATSVKDTDQIVTRTSPLSSPTGAESITNPSSTPTREVISESLIGYVRGAYPEITRGELVRLSPRALAKLNQLCMARSEPFNETIKQIANFYFGSGSGWCEKPLAEALNFYLEEQI